MDVKNTTLDDIASVIGFSATLRLSAWFGDGNNLYIPDTVDDSQFLVKLLGRSAAQRLSEAFPKEHLAVPRLAGYDEDVRRQRIGSLLEVGFSTRKVSKFERISERRVQQICRELETAGLIAPVGPAKVADEKPRGVIPRENWTTGSRGEKRVGKAAAKSPLGKADGKNAKQKCP